jgi:hypothetical protein
MNYYTATFLGSAQRKKKKVSVSRETKSLIVLAMIANDRKLVQSILPGTQYKRERGSLMLQKIKHIRDLPANSSDYARILMRAIF